MIDSLRKILDEVSSTQDFTLLDPFRDSAEWGQIGVQDRVVLAKLFVKCGELELKEGKDGPLSTFELANQLAPKNSQLLLEQANAYALYGDILENLICAADAAEEAESANPHCLNSKMTWANVMVEIGVKKKDPSHFYQANSKYQQICESENFQKQRDPQFYWHWGVCWHYIAKQSGEASDFVKALSKYKEAENLDLSDIMFFNDYGNALVDLACLVSREDLLIQSSELYQKVVESAPDFYEGWFNLACTNHRLWQMKGEEKYFLSANKAFDQAASLNAGEASLWFKWAQFLFHAGKDQLDIQLIQESLDKFLKANTLLPDHASILGEWAEAQLLLGVMTEKLEYLKWAKVAILRALELEPENANHWATYGRCLIELGRYFQDESYLQESIEKLNYSISLHRTDSRLWYGLATSYHILSDLKDSPSLCEKAVKYYSRVTEFDGEMTPDFWNEWGVALMRMGEYTQDKRWVEAASEKFEHSIRLFYLLHDPATINPTWLYHYGTALDFLGDFTNDEKFYEKAIKVLSQSLVLDPSHYKAKYHLALSFAHLAEIVSDVDCFQKSLEIFAEILQQEPEDDIAWIDWGLALLNLAELVHDPAHTSYTERLMKEAEEKLMRSASLGNEASYYYLACLYSLQERLPEAFHYLERAELANALPTIEEMIHDEWLCNLRSTNNFQEFLRHLNRK
ncbi:MAG: hypothetical protein K940chlam3_00334 [Chlamydiae bacterium]|nr:hypothetical protein [Chlamydiota bacterium]